MGAGVAVTDASRLWRRRRSTGSLTAGRPSAPAASDLFQQETVRTYASRQSTPQNGRAWTRSSATSPRLPPATTSSPTTRFVFHLDQETVANAAIQLHASRPGWQTVMLDGDRAKMQSPSRSTRSTRTPSFTASTKLIFDMRGRTDLPHDRLAHAWLRQSGIMAACAASARLMINGSLYGSTSSRKRSAAARRQAVLPHNADAICGRAVGDRDETSRLRTCSRRDAFGTRPILAAVSRVVDLEGSVSDVGGRGAAEHNADGYYGGFHTLIYDQGDKGFVFLPQDTDATFDWWRSSICRARKTIRCSGGSRAPTRPRCPFSTG